MKRPTVVYKYVGKGAWMTRIPKRDLTDVDLLDFEIDTAKLEKSGLYQKVEPKKKSDKKAGEQWQDEEL